MKCTIFGDENFKKFFKKETAKQYVADTNIQCFDKAIIANEHEHGFGVFDKDFNFIQDSLQIRKDKGQFIPKLNHDNIPYGLRAQRQIRIERQSRYLDRGQVRQKG